MGQKTYKYNRLLKLLTLVLLLSLVIYCVKTQRDIAAMRGKLDAVQQQVEQQRLVNKDLELSLRRDDSYMERSARENLDYAHPEERVYVDTSGGKISQKKRGFFQGMELAVGSIVEGKVAKITNYGAFVDFEGGGTGMIHISEVANTYVKDINDHLKVGETVKVKVIGINEQNKVSLSIKATLDKPAPAPRFQGGRQGGGQGGRPFTPPRSYGRSSAPASTGDSFEDMMNRFKRTSDDKMSDLRRIDNRRSGNSRRGHSK